jgi:hypothetical protein
MSLKDTEHIETFDVENEIWFHHINKFANYKYVSNLIGNWDKKIQIIINLTKQAQDIYDAYKQRSPIIKPILLFYSFEKVAALLLKLKNPSIHNTNHGVSYDDKRITIQKN